MDICTTLGIHIKPHVKHSSLIFGTVVGLSHSHMGHMGVSAAISPLLTQVFNPYAGHSEHWLPTGWATHPNNNNISWIGKPNSVWSDVDLENRNNIPTDSQFDPSSHGKNQTVFETSQHLPAPLRHWHGHYFCSPNPNRRLRALCSHLTRSYHSWNLPWVEICGLHWSSSMMRHFSRHKKNSHIRRHPAPSGAIRHHPAPSGAIRLSSIFQSPCPGYLGEKTRVPYF